MIQVQYALTTVRTSAGTPSTEPTGLQQGVCRSVIFYAATLSIICSYIQSLSYISYKIHWPVHRCVCVCFNSLAISIESYICFTHLAPWPVRTLIGFTSLPSTFDLECPACHCLQFNLCLLMIVPSLSSKKPVRPWFLVILSSTCPTFAPMEATIEYHFQKMIECVSLNMFNKDQFGCEMCKAHYN